MAPPPALTGSGTLLQPPSLRALKWFWLVVLLAFAGGAATLALLGPPVKLVTDAVPVSAEAAPAAAAAAPEVAAGQAAAGIAASAGLTTRLPDIWPQRLGNSWSSIITAAAPARA